MNMQTTNVMAPPPPKRLEEMRLPTVMMRDIILKTVFRKNIDMVSDLARAVCLPIPVTQELIDMTREQRLMEATGTMSAGASGEMGYQLTDAGKARALDALAAGGSTNGEAGIETAYRLADERFIEGGINRVLLATDGDFNVGLDDTEALIALIEKRRASGIALTTLGFGGGNYDDHLMERLADAGDGNYAYIKIGRASCRERV